MEPYGFIVRTEPEDADAADTGGADMPDDVWTRGKRCWTVARTTKVTRSRVPDDDDSVRESNEIRQLSEHDEDDVEEREPDEQLSWEGN